MRKGKARPVTGYSIKVGTGPGSYGKRFGADQQHEAAEYYREALRAHGGGGGAGKPVEFNTERAAVQS